MYKKNPFCHFRQATATVIFNNEGDRPSLATLSRKFYNNSTFFEDCFRYMQRKNQDFIYLCIDTHTKRKLPEEYKTRSNIFPMNGEEQAKPLFFRPKLR
jgi:hypothetical protein